MWKCGIWKSRFLRLYCFWAVSNFSVRQVGASLWISMDGWTWVCNLIWEELVLKIQNGDLTTQRNVASLSWFGLLLRGILTFKWVKVSISSFILLLFYDPSRSESIWVDPTRAVSPSWSSGCLLYLPVEIWKHFVFWKDEYLHKVLLTWICTCNCFTPVMHYFEVSLKHTCMQQYV